MTRGPTDQPSLQARWRPNACQEEAKTEFIEYLSTEKSRESVSGRLQKGNKSSGCLGLGISIGKECRVPAFSNPGYGPVEGE